MTPPSWTTSPSRPCGAHGVVKMGTAIQVVIGTDADPIAAEIEDMM